MADNEKNEDEITEEPAADEVEVVASEDQKSTEAEEIVPEASEDSSEVVETEEIIIPVEAEETAPIVPTAAQKAALYMEKFLRDDHPDFKAGDTVKVHYKIIEGSKERIQVFEGVVISKKHSGLDKTFSVRKISWNVGVERTFFFHSKKIDKIQVVRRGRVRRAKIYYLRERAGKAARIKELRKPVTRKN